ncbi:glycosyltransferase [Marinobacter sp. CA1]|uniref:glycosyltransferase n=1 Tax=Marinobacter sp. CA1 TaxID=2817656 RepID=UPI001D0934B2|nr:glycosyltransferase [Marinobacter sp. CA1]UDL03847.1 glycosyltransferase [Marinobacter sp. CA1]
MTNSSNRNYSNQKPTLLVLASTYPRWKNDHEPNFVHKLCQELSEQYDITVVTSRSPRAEKFEQLDNINVRRFIYAPAGLETLVYGGGILTNLRRRPWKWILVPSFLVGMGLSTLKTIAEIKPQAIHCHWLIPQGLVLWALSLFKKLPPVLLTSHGGDLFSLRGKLGSNLKRKALSKASAVTVVSTPMKPIALDLGASNNSTYVAPMGFGFRNKGQTTQKERTPGQILFVGRLVEKKGVEHLIKALPAVLQSNPACELVIIGDGPEREHLERQAKELSIASSVHFLGALPQDELPKFYQTASLFCAPFIEAKNGDVEGLGLVTVEAMSFGCPVLIGNVEAALDVIPEKYRASCLISPKDSVCFSEKIIEALNTPIDDEQQLELQNFVYTRFSWSEVKNNYSEIIKGLK